MAKWDAKNLEIRTRSVEQTLVPLVSQVTALVHLKERTRIKNAAKVSLHNSGSDLEKSINKFADIGEYIAKENIDISIEMRELCEEARRAGEEFAVLTDLENNSVIDRLQLVDTARSLLASVTRSLLLADMIAMKKLSLAAQRVDERLKELEDVHNFTDFVQAFSQFGADMVELAHISGDRQNDLKDDRQRAEMCAARAVLEKSTMMLLTTCKTCLRHPDSPIAQGNRDGVFKSMREAMKTLRAILEDNHVPNAELSKSLGIDIKDFEIAVEILLQRRDDVEARNDAKDKMGLILVGSENIVNTGIVPEEKRNKVLSQCENLRDQVADLENILKWKYEPSEKSNTIIRRAAKQVDEIKLELVHIAAEAMVDVFSDPSIKNNVQSLKTASLDGNTDGVELFALKVKEDSLRMREVSKLVCNVTASEPVIITSRKIEENMKSFLPQLSDAARILSGHPSSKITQENMEVFADVWDTQVEELSSLLKSVVQLDRKRGSDIKVDKEETLECNNDFFFSEIEKTKASSLERIFDDLNDDFDLGDDSLGEKGVSDDGNKAENPIPNLESLSCLLESLGDSSHLDLVASAQELLNKAQESFLRLSEYEHCYVSPQEILFLGESVSSKGDEVYRFLRQLVCKDLPVEARGDVVKQCLKVKTHSSKLRMSSKAFAVGDKATGIQIDAVLREIKKLATYLVKAIDMFFGRSIKGDGSGSGSLDYRIVTIGDDLATSSMSSFYSISSGFSQSDWKSGVDSEEDSWKKGLAF